MSRSMKTVFVIVVTCCLLACGENPSPGDGERSGQPAEGEKTAAPVRPEGSANVKATAESREEAKLPSTEDLLETTPPSSGDTNDSALKLTLTRTEWTKETAYVERRFTLKLENTSGEAIGLDRALLKPACMVYVEDLDGRAIEIMPAFARKPSQKTSSPEVLTLNPGAEESMGFTLADISSADTFDVMSYTVRCVYDGKAVQGDRADKLLWKGTASSNKVRVEALGEVFLRDMNGRVTKKMSDGAATSFEYSSDGQLTRVGPR